MMMIRLGLVLLLLVAPLFADERILSFESTIVVEEGGDLVVTEKLRVRAEGDQIRRGIFRDIPRLQETKWGLKKKKPFEVLGVKQDGAPAHYEVSGIGRGGMRIRIGREDEFLKRGEHVYEISYRTGMQLYFEEKRDVLYWNVNGAQWDFPTDKVSVTVVLPEGIAVARVDGSTGGHGAEGTDFRGKASGNIATLSTTRALGKREGLTIVVEWPPGMLAAEAYAKAGGSLLADHPGVVLAAVLMAASFLYYLVAWFLVGKDPAKGVIIPHYEPPPGFSPAAVRFLDRMKFDNTCFSAGVVGLAVKGVATIEQEGKSYAVKNLGMEQQREPLEVDELALYNKLLGSRKEVELNWKTFSE